MGIKKRKKIKKIINKRFGEQKMKNERKRKRQKEEKGEKMREEGRKEEEKMWAKSTRVEEGKTIFWVLNLAYSN